MVIVYQGRNSHSGRLDMIKYMIRRVISRVQLLASERSERDTLRSVQLRIADIYNNVIVINHMRGLYGFSKSRDTRAKPEWQGFMNRVQTECWFITIYSPQVLRTFSVRC